jgi:hypothetical protein
MMLFGRRYYPMIVSRFIDGLVPLAAGIYATLLAFGLLRAHKKETAEKLKEAGGVLKIFGPLVILYGLYLWVTSF